MLEGSVPVSLVVPDLHKESSGITPALVYFANAIHQAGASTMLYTLQPTPEQIPALDPDVTLQVLPRSPFLYRLGLSGAMAATLRRLATRQGIVHNHSLWMMPNILSGCYCNARARARLVVSPHGTLSPWALSRSRLNKGIAWHLLGQKKVLRNAALFHATSKQEQHDIRAAGYTGPIALVPYGINLPNLDSAAPRKGEQRTLLYLSRIHPGKGVDTLLEAWQRLWTQFPDWQLRIAGPLDNAYAQGMQQRTRELGLGRVEFCGELRGEAKRRACLAADLFVLPSRSENFGFAIAEALAHGLPVITTEGTPWEELPTRGCGWYCKADVDGLEGSLEHALRLDRTELANMGARGRAWMQEAHDWSRAGSNMLAAYRWLLGQAERPAHVSID